MLLEEIQEASKQVASETYSMSVGELVSMYKEGELNIHPEFQRFFRWSPYQKSRFIESLVLGLPIPPVYVLQRADGKWDVIDGLQRISTLLELMGELKDKEGTVKPALVLQATKYLPSLSSTVWKMDAQDVKELPAEFKLMIRRARLDVKILLASKSDPSSKYEMFDRLNTGGALATPQEVRSCMIMMANEKFFSWMNQLASYIPYKNALPLTERQEGEQYNLEILVRYFCLRDMDANSLSSINDINSFLTDRIVSLAMVDSFNYEKEEADFKVVFAALENLHGENIFRKFNGTSFSGPFLLSSFEVLAVGLGWWVSGNGYDEIDARANYLFDKLWGEHPSEMTSVGMRASTRLSSTIPLGRSLASSYGY